LKRDYNWYLSVSDIFNFDGKKEYFNKKGVYLIQYDEEGKSAKDCFYLYDTSGVIKKTNEPVKLRKLLKTKGSVNLHIKMYAEDRGRGYLPLAELVDMCKEYKSPDWFFDAIERQKCKYY